MDAKIAEQAARHLWAEHEGRANYNNLPAELRPANLDDAYEFQDAFHVLARQARGSIAGWKIATTTKVMQQLMGLDRPCAGAIFERTIHRSPARLRAADYVNLKIECELAFRLGADLPAAGAPFTAESVFGTIEAMMPAFELIDDRNAVYKETEALSLIADNCWNQGIVIGEPRPVPPAGAMNDLRGRMEIAERPALEGGADGPLEALAWIANLIASRGGELRRGMVVMTGSLVPTTAIAAGETAVFAVAGLGDVHLAVT